MKWDELNSDFIDRACVLEELSSIRTESLTPMHFIGDNVFKISWTRNNDVSKKHLTSDTLDIQDMGELSLHVPVLLFHGVTAHEINRLLIQKVIDKILVSQKTSCPPTT